MICGNIARDLGLPIPPFKIMDLPYNIFDAWAQFHPNEDPIVTPATHQVFASQDVEFGHIITDAAELKALDPSCAVQVYLFDRFVKNTDRIDMNSNMIFRPDTGMFFIIDHNNALADNFDATDFDASHILRDAYKKASTEVVEAFEARIRSLVTQSYLETLWNDMPPEWTEEGSCPLTLGAVCNILLDA